MKEAPQLKDNGNNIKKGMLYLKHTFAKKTNMVLLLPNSSQLIYLGFSTFVIETSKGNWRKSSHLLSSNVSMSKILKQN